MFDETGDAAKSQGWTPFVLDTNGNGKRDDYVEPNQPIDPAKDKRIVPGSVLRRDAEPGRRLDLGHGRRVPARIVRIDPALEPATRRCRKSTTCRCPASASRGGDIDKQGRRLGVARERPPGQLRPAQVQGPAQRPEGDRRSLPRGLGVPPVSRPGLRRHRREQRRVELLHLGRPAQHVRARRGHADVDRQPAWTAWSRSRTARWSRCACPYPLGFYAKGFDGRIDDPNAGWKGRGLWSANGDRTPWLMEGGKGTKPLRRALPAAARSAGEVNAAALTTIAGAAPTPPLFL